jgi:hypothetical protein
VTVKTLTGKNVELYQLSTDTVLMLKSKLREREGIPEDQMRLVFAGKQMDDDSTLARLGIRTGAVIHLILRLRGGGSDPVPFKFSEMKDATVSQLSAHAPDWRTVAPGVCMEGKCMNANCDAFERMVIETLGFGEFSCNRQIRCPACDTLCPAVTTGFFQCHWSFAGQKADGTVHEAEPQRIDQEYHRFNETQETNSAASASASSSSWAYLVVRGTEWKPTPLFLDTDCAICLEEFSKQMSQLAVSPVVEKEKENEKQKEKDAGKEKEKEKKHLSCGHVFHTTCVNEWLEKHQSCPLCRKTVDKPTA